jgi:hypothetical protein
MRLHVELGHWHTRQVAVQTQSSSGYGGAVVLDA